MRKLIFTLALGLLSTIIASYSQSVPAVRNARPAKAHYKELSLLDRKPNSAFAWMDTITFPRKEVATSTMAVTMWRTAYLIDEVPELLEIEEPPANSSEQTRKELEYLLKLQSLRTERDINRYRMLAGIYHSPNNFNQLDPDYDRNFSSLFHVGSPLGKWYSYKNLPVTAKFLSNVYRDAMYYVFKMKMSFNRPRPYHLESKLEALEKPYHQSYPSGHSAGSFVNAYIMMEIAPELTDEFLKAAEEMAISREYLGCHYPSDSEMGRLWARKFVNELFKKEKFRRDFELAKKEILEFKKK
jgi:acid phosphatase (class A)